MISDVFIKSNICEFKEGACIANRAGLYEGKDGCCASGPRGICKHLTSNGCSDGCRSLGCRLWICSYLAAKYPDVNKILGVVSGIAIKLGIPVETRRSKEEILGGVGD